MLQSANEKFRHDIICSHIKVINEAAKNTFKRCYADGVAQMIHVST